MAPRSDATSGAPGNVPELDLEVRKPSAPQAKPKVESESPFELAVDAQALVRERSAPPLQPAPVQAFLAVTADLAFDARLLADFGDPPRNWVFSPLYAYRVLKRRRELKRALAGRREEAGRAAGAAEDALVAFAERARATAETTTAYSGALDELRHAEELLRSRDRVLADEQDAQNARLAQVDARLAKLEAELVQAQRDEHAIGAELSESQGALGREEARLKRAEIELRAAHQRASSGGDG
jgi:hypothetical protein